MLTGIVVQLHGMTKRPHIFSDLSLSRRLERAEAVANARFVEAQARYRPSSGATWIDVAGAYAMYDGPRSPCTQTFGLGLFQMPDAADMDRIERFFKDRLAPVIHEVSPLADKALLPMLADRGYRPIELTTILFFLPLADRPSPPAAGDQLLKVRAIQSGEEELWARTLADGWSDSIDFVDLLMDLGRSTALREGSESFLAELGGLPIAAGAVSTFEGVALLAGASTIPEFRKQGAQNALLHSRLEYAARAGCDLAMIGTSPGSASQRNSERQGFRIAYTRIKWSLEI